ncbi:MAG: taxilin [Chloroflexi bacterium]|nr:taxilin [Chloroflexota bacterium]
MKRLEAIVAATVVTAVIALAMLAVGLNALVNQNSVPVSNSPALASSATTAGTDPPSQAQIDQLKSLVAQYQSREQQYQTQLSQENAQIQQLQNVLAQLQQRGVIRILNDGTIQLRGFGGDGD